MLRQSLASALVRCVNVPLSLRNAAMLGPSRLLTRTVTNAPVCAIPIRPTTYRPAQISRRTPFYPGRFFHSSAHWAVHGVGESLIPSVNRLQEIFTLAGTKIDLPQIVVVGGQSSGKSSVLENVVGRDFLPRGAGIVTRRPLILQLIPLSPGSRDYGEFLHLPGKRFTDFDEIKREIERDTERVCGGNKGVSNIPILLKIYSPRVLPLTLVDTPGIARVPIGDQPHDIEAQTKALVREFISKPNAIILAVQPANQDLATSDALNLAREVDKEGARTLGVLTKLDLMDRGTDAMAVLLGRQFPLRHGWTAIVNRSQQDIENHRPIDDAQNSESSFFNAHPTYRTIADRCGSHVLSDKCNKLLSEHIRKTLPELRVQIKRLIKEREAELAQYGEPVLEDEASQGFQLMTLLSKFAQTYEESLTGNLTTLEKFSKTNSDLTGGARLRYIFNVVFAEKLNSVKGANEISNQEIRNAIYNAQGSRPSLFVPDAAFEHLARKEIERLREPCLEAAEAVYSELGKILGELDYKEVTRFWRLREKIIDVSNEVVRKQLKEAQRMINTSLDLELAYINTSHPDFIGLTILNGPSSGSASSSTSSKSGGSDDSDGGGFFSFVFGSGKSTDRNRKTGASRDPYTSQTLTDKEKTQIKLIRQLLDSYLSIVARKLHDQVTKIVMMVLVNDSSAKLQKALVSSLYQGNINYSFLLAEDDEVGMKRAVARKELEALRRAKKVIQMSELSEW